MTLTRSVPSPSRDLSTKFKQGLTGTPARQESRPASPPAEAASAGQNGDAPEMMERGEVRSNHGSGSTSTTVNDNDRNAQAVPPTEKENQHHLPTEQKQVHRKSWCIEPEIPRSDSRGRVLTFDEGGVRVEEGRDGRIHVIHEPGV